MPRRVALTLLEQVLGIRPSLGSVQNSREEVGAAVAEPCAEHEVVTACEWVMERTAVGHGKSRSGITTTPIIVSSEGEATRYILKVRPECNPQGLPRTYIRGFGLQRLWCSTWMGF